MAYVKKSIENAEATMDSVEETAEKAAKIEATSAPATDQSSEIAALKAQIEMLTKMMAAGMGAPQPATKAPELGEDKIKIVHLYEYPEGFSTHLTYSNGILTFTTLVRSDLFRMQSQRSLLGVIASFLMKDFSHLAKVRKDMRISLMLRRRRIMRLWVPIS